MEVFIDAPLQVVEDRDPKGLYKKARAGEIKGEPFHIETLLSIADVLCTDFTGISAPYEAPESPEIHIRTDEVGVADAVRIIVDYLVAKQYITL